MKSREQKHQPKPKPRESFFRQLLRDAAPTKPHGRKRPSAKAGDDDQDDGEGDDA